MRYCLMNGFGVMSLSRDPGRRSSVPTPLPRSELGLEPVHHRPQLLALHLDLVTGLLGAHAVEVLLARAVLGDPLARELARLDLGEDGLHRLARVLPDDPRPARQVAVLGGRS